MNVLVVDDQVDVVQGVIAGLDWKTLDVENVFAAYGASEAKAIFRRNLVHVLLCDIEMPEKNGLELFKWVREHYRDVECIFLSAHAEFEYAKEAIQLGSFDYIVQPARYEEIQLSVRRALEKVRENQQMQQVYEYGAYWRQNQETLLDNCVRGFLSDPGADMAHLVSDLRSLRIRIDSRTRLRPVLIQLLDGEGALLQWEAPLIKFALKNFCGEILEPVGQELAFVQLDRESYLALLAGVEETEPSQNLMQLLELFLSVCREDIGCRAAAYVGNGGGLDGLREEYGELCRMRENNVARYSRVFTRMREDQLGAYTYAFPDIEHWSMLLSHGSAALVRRQAHRYLEEQKQRGVMNAPFLARFHQDFIQMVLSAVKTADPQTRDIFFDNYPFEDYIKAYTSLEKMHALIDYALNYLEEKNAGGQERQSPIEQAIAYISENIEKDISRAEIAEAIFLNPEYLSRLFKKEKGVSLGDFIVTRKMEIARSLLANTPIPINIVASKVGYSNFSYFSKVFKKASGLTPQEYRQANGKHTRA